MIFKTEALTRIKSNVLTINKFWDEALEISHNHRLTDEQQLRAIGQRLDMAKMHLDDLLAITKFGLGEPQVAPEDR